MIAPIIFYCFERLLRIYRSVQKVTILKVRYSNFMDLMKNLPLCFENNGFKFMQLKK